MEMSIKKAVILSVLLLCGAAGAEMTDPDWDLGITIVGDASVLVNHGDDAIAIGTIVFTDEQGGNITATSLGGWFPGYIGLPNGTTEIAFVTFGASAVLAAGEQVNIGHIGPEGTPGVWGASHMAGDPEPVYRFDWVPEPASMSMLALGAMALVRRRR